MSEVLDILRTIREDGITLFTVFAILGFLFTVYESRRKQLRYERMENKLDSLLQERGIAWTGQPDELQMVLMNLKQWQRLYLAAGFRVGLLYKRRESKMDKKWLVLLVTYIVGYLSKMWGIELPDGTPETIVNALTIISNGFMLLAPVFLAFMNKMKKPKDKSADNSDIFIQGNR